MCLLCGRPFAGPSGTDHLCGRCLLCPPSYDRARSLFHFTGVVRKLVHRVKFLGCGHALKALCDLAREELGDCEMSSGLIVPVPLHPRRLRSRGFNQSAMIARGIFPEGRVCVDLLAKVRDTRPQTGLGAGERAGNVRGAFALARALPKGVTRVTLVDDVYTTGATVSECAKVLKKGGVEEVHVLTVARTPLS